MVYFTPFAILCVLCSLFVMLPYLWKILAPLPGISLECEPLEGESLATKQGSSGDGGSASPCSGQHKSPSR